MRASSGEAIERVLWRSLTTEVWLCVDKASSSDVISCSSCICLSGSSCGDEPTFLRGLLAAVAGTEVRLRLNDILLRLCSKSEPRVPAHDVEYVECDGYNHIISCKGMQQGVTPLGD